MEGQGRPRKVMDSLFPSLKDYSVSPSPSPIPFPLDLGPGFGTWIWDLDLGLGLGLTLHFKQNSKFWGPSLY